MVQHVLSKFRMKSYPKPMFFVKCFQLSQTFKITAIIYQHKLLVQLDAVSELVWAGAGMSSTWPLMNVVAASNPPPSSSGPAPTAGADGCRGSAVQRWRLTDEICGCESCPTDKLHPRPSSGGGCVQALSADQLHLWPSPGFRVGPDAIGADRDLYRRFITGHRGCQSFHVTVQPGGSG